MIRTFYTYFRSSAAYRVRIGLNLKGVKPERVVAINLKEGQQNAVEYTHVNPARSVPAIELENGQLLTQSAAILEWLEESVPRPPLLPQDVDKRAEVRSFCQVIACDIHPLNNLRILNQLEKELMANDAQRNRWYASHITRGFQVLELQLLQRRHHTPYCYGNEPGMADVFLVPQVYNAERFNVDLSAFPLLMDMAGQARRHPAFIAAAPDYAAPLAESSA